jgi:hypothetical protein
MPAQPMPAQRFPSRLLPFDYREDAAEGFEESVGRFLSPVSEDSLKVTRNSRAIFEAMNGPKTVP